MCSSFCAVGTSNTAIVAAPIVLTVPSFAIPEIVNCRVGPSAEAPILPPTRRLCFTAVPCSITTWSDPVAHLPSTSFIGLNCGYFGSRPKPNVGAPPVPPIVLPFRSISFTRSVEPPKLMIPPAAAWTSGSARTLSSTFADTVAFPLAAPLTISLPEMTTLVFL